MRGVAVHGEEGIELREALHVGLDRARREVLAPRWRRNELAYTSRSLGSFGRLLSTVGTSVIALVPLSPVGWSASDIDRLAAVRAVCKSFVRPFPQVDAPLAQSG